MRDNTVVLGFDVGSHKTGVAIGQTLTNSARILHKIHCQDGIPVPFLQVTDLLNQWRPHVIVVGLPYRPDGKPQRATQHALAFIELLRQHTHIPIHTVDESLTTKSARADLFESGGFKQLQKSDVDSYAAKLIVESWLNEQGVGDC